MKYFSWSNLGLGLFVLYLANSFNVFYTLYYPNLCTEDSISCFAPQFPSSKKYDFHLYATTSINRISPEDLLYSKRGISLAEPFEEEVQLLLKKSFTNNVTVYGQVFVVRNGDDPLIRSVLSAHYSTTLTSFKRPDAKKVNLLKGISIIDNTTVMAHWRPRLLAHILDPDVKFDTLEYPAELRRMMDRSSLTYKPVLYVDQLSVTRRYDQPMTSQEVNLTVSFSPITIGKLRIWLQFEDALRNLQALGFGEDDIDEVKGIFSDTNMYLLTLTFFVSVFHLLFDFLAFKNDISFWRRRKNTAGLSTRVVVWRSVSQIIIFLYLCEHKTSYIVLGPAGVGMLIELWKVSKSLKFSVVGGKVQFGERSEEEKVTDEIDREAMRYLQWVMYPLLLGGAVYSLLYMPQRSWYSWVINSLVNGVYCFGFLFMTPQLFLNYRLKSVAHLPWRAFMYKAFNTFIDDVFAFIITMPTAHRIACFRDDVIFLVYLYQRWLYPVDKSRVNEYGQVFEEEEVAPGDNGEKLEHSPPQEEVSEQEKKEQ